LTFSRSAYLTLGLAILTLCIIEFSSVRSSNRISLLKNVAIFAGIAIICLCVEELLGGNTLSRIIQRWDIVSEGQTIEPSAAQRIKNWKIGLEIFYKHPIFGVGYNNYGNIAKDIGQPIKESQLFGNDSSWILILATTGIVGLIVFLLAYIVFIVDLIKIFKCNLYEPYIRMISSSLAAYLVGLAISTNFNNLLFYPPIICQVFIIYAVIYPDMYSNKIY
jgi:O-antigen ligase